MKRKLLIIFTLCILLLTTLFIYFSSGYRGYYYKTDNKIGDNVVYNYQVISFSGYCKGLEIVNLYEDDDYKYYVYYYCDGRGSFIKHNGKYLRLNEALEMNIVNLDDIKVSNLLRKEPITKYTFQAKVISNNGMSLTIEPKLGTNERNSGEQIIINLHNTTLLDINDQEIDLNLIELGKEVMIEYNGLIASTHPGQINNCYVIQLIN